MSYIIVSLSVCLSVCFSHTYSSTFWNVLDSLAPFEYLDQFFLLPSFHLCLSSKLKHPFSLKVSEAWKDDRKSHPSCSRHFLYSYCPVLRVSVPTEGFYGHLPILSYCRLSRQQALNTSVLCEAGQGSEHEKLRHKPEWSWGPQDGSMAVKVFVGKRSWDPQPI